MTPLVSILIPCYNAERWIEQSISSALNQTYENIEVIVVDDGSTDRSLEAIKSFGTKIYWETRENCGGNVTRNRLLTLSRGSWLQYLDADDYLLPDKIARQVEFINHRSDTDIVYSPSIIQHHYSQQDNTNKIDQAILPIPQPHDPWILLARWYLPQTGSLLWRKQAIMEVGGWRENQPCCQEHELYLRLLQGGKQFNYFDNAGSIYRQWSESTVCKKNKTETYRRRLEITDKLEQYLVQTQQLTELRQQQINQARFECARIIWLSNKQWANKIIRQIHNCDRAAYLMGNRAFIPSGECAPEIYRLMYQFLGFEMTEKLAAMKRKLVIIDSSPP